MSDYQPKVGDRVMVGEHGPYEVTALSGEDSEYVQIEIPTDMPRKFRSVLPEWLTPAPEPEPDEPPTPGALVRFGNELAVQRGDLYELSWLILTGPLAGSVRRWDELTNITVILADPAEVEALRGQRDDLFAQRDELQRRIDRALNELTCIGGTIHRAVTILRGES